MRMPVLMSLLLILCGAAQAEIYRWVDENGVINYSQLKPHNQEASPLHEPRKRRNPYSAPAEPLPPTAPGSEPQFSQRQRAMLDDLRAAEVERQAAVGRIRETNCATSRRVLEKLQQNGRIRRRSADGNVSVMPEEERQAQIQAAQESIALNCA